MRQVGSEWSSGRERKGNRGEHSVENIGKGDNGNRVSSGYGHEEQDEVRRKTL